MSVLEVALPGGIGDIIYAKAQLDCIANRYTQINISFSRHMIENFHGNTINYENFLYQLAALLFKAPKYNVVRGVDFPQRSQVDICRMHGTKLQRIKVDNLLCSENFTPIAEPYIVITTKVRWYNRQLYNAVRLELWKEINKLSSRYKIIVMGEKVVEMNEEYSIYGTSEIYSIYQDAIGGIPASALVDRTVPSLGITAPDINQLREDCSIMRGARCVITIGVGGNFAISTAVSKYTLGLRNDGSEINRELFEDHHYNDCDIVKDHTLFLNKLRSL